jgi:AcrR family transcriptional regulator
VSHTRWQRHYDGAVALDKILDAAGTVLAQRGVRRATMTDVARAAGCSRATLYRYFPDQDDLRHAFVHRATLRIARQLAEDRRNGAPAALADRILAGISAVRADPLLAIWFEPENMAVPIALSQSSELLQAMTTGLIDELGVGALDPAEAGRRGEWLLRCIVSLLAMPGSDDETERTLVESFVVPVLVMMPQPKGAHDGQP